MARAEPISQALDTETDPERRRRLELVLETRSFAESSGLDVGGSYEEVSETSDLAVAYVVTAAFRDRLEPYQWSYPIIGRVPYRGYFERSRADGFASKLRGQGYDTHVVRAGAYSTLGWFDDPLPSSVLAYDDVAVVDLVLHELGHRTVYVPNDIAFNETLASAVAARLTIRFFELRKDGESARIARRRHEAWLEQGRLLDALAARLDGYFAKTAGSSATDRLAGRQKIYLESLAALESSGLIRPEPALSTEERLDRLNNAIFLALWRYRKDSQMIEAYLDRWPDVDVALRSLPSAVEGEGSPYDALR